MPSTTSTVLGRIWGVITILWTVMVIITLTSFGTFHGWQNHGLVGALALGFVGLVAGVLLSRSTIVIELLSNLR